MRRKDREMDRAFALAVLDKCEHAVLAVADSGGSPYCVPVTIVRDGEDLYFHCALEGRKVELLHRDGRVCLTAVGDTHIPDDDFTTEYESAVVFGRAHEVVDDAGKLEALRLLCRRHVPAHMDAFEEAAARSLRRTGVWRVRMETVTGKRKKYGRDGKELKFGRMESKMERKIIKIDEEQCNGCGLCAAACHEGAIGMVNGKARLLREDYCDGLGDCLPACPTGAITFEVREAPAYDAAAVAASQTAARAGAAPLPCGCPGTQSRSIRREGVSLKPVSAARPESQLSQWPVQIQLVPVNAPYFDGARLLVAADCTAYAYAAFHQDFIRGRITLVGCPKLDDADYAEKLTAILRENDVKSVTVVRMEVPCCGGLEAAVKRALQESGKCIPWQVSVISTDGRLLDV